eukprot:CAMPEP_0117521122 /NCGR_PEP_ID=MMETSP0784-20121206/33521_1 /TAXON_ID=39447 /ORGANISM="" /LENGTH=62 /DNA_ID=CAMNT_0005317137 /DNA_START=120 /DNA_END=304 /DNA_ORIENTATION=+
MASRRSSPLLVAIVCVLVALCGLRLATTFVAPPSEVHALRGTAEDFERTTPAVAQAAALGVA